MQALKEAQESSTRLWAASAPRAPFNRAGRIIDITGEAGTEERFYSKLGEVVKETRTIASDTQGKSANSPEGFYF